MSMSSDRRFAVRRAALCIAAALSAAGCSKTLRPAEDVDLRYRAHIAVASEQKTLVLFSRGMTGRLDADQTAKIADFAKAYRSEARGPMIVAVPHAGEGRPRRPEGLLSSLAGHGISGRSVRLTTYVPDPALEPGIRLAYETVGAKAICDDRPPSRFDTDPGAARMGCAYASAIAANVADPLDLAEPRARGLYRFTKATGERLAEPAAPGTPISGTR